MSETEQQNWNFAIQRALVDWVTKRSATSNEAGGITSLTWVQAETEHTVKTVARLVQQGEDAGFTLRDTTGIRSLVYEWLANGEAGVPIRATSILDGDDNNDASRPGNAGECFLGFCCGRFPFPFLSFPFLSFLPAVDPFPSRKTNWNKNIDSNYRTLGREGRRHDPAHSTGAGAPDAHYGPRDFL